jgi:predicted amidohydrolase YtcJ
VGIELASPELWAPFWDKLRRQDLDKVAPDNLLMVHVGTLSYMINTKVAEAIKVFYGFQAEEFEIDKSGLSNGRIDFTLVRNLMADLMVDRPMQSLYPAFKKEMQKYARFGITTWSTSLSPFSYQPVFREMDRRGELPIRFAYAQTMGVAVFPYAGDFYRRLGDVTDMGTDWFWSTGGGVVHIDGAPCTKLKPSNPCYAAKPDDVKRKALYEMVKYGNRITGTHVAGDGAVDNLLDVIEEASKAAGMTPAEIQAKGHSLDHCTLNPRPDQIERGKKLGVIWSCGPATIENGAAMAREYGLEEANQLIAPVGAILRAGGKVAGEGEVAGEMPNDSYFTYLELLQTRKDSAGRVWGKNQAIDRKDALRMYTMGSAEYLGRPGRIGSLEEGKFADLAVLDRDYMTIPAEEFHKIRVVLTMVGGRIVYQQEKP